MNDFKLQINQYLNYCKEQKRLDIKTLKAYKVDLFQFHDFIMPSDINVTKEVLYTYITSLHSSFKQKTVKRKLASLKAFYHYYEREEVIEINPMRKITTKFREEKLLPKTIPENIIEDILRYCYSFQNRSDVSVLEKKKIIRDVAVIELLFATGLRISELCNLKANSVDLNNGVLCIRGKGAKERNIQIGNAMVLKQLSRYKKVWLEDKDDTIYFFLNRYNNRFSEQSARKMLHAIMRKAQIQKHITPHMFRHSFATLLLEEDVDIRYIQKMLGHSSITTTQIYTEVTSKKQMEILRTKHPRNRMIMKM